MAPCQPTQTLNQPQSSTAAIADLPVDQDYTLQALSSVADWGHNRLNPSLIHQPYWVLWVGGIFSV